MIDHPDPEGSTGLTSATLALTYDPALVSVSPSDITLGSIPSQGTGWQLSAVVDQTTGQIGIQIYSLTPITVNQAGSLVNIAFTAIGERRGVSPPVLPSVQLVDTVTPNGQWFGTGVADTQGAMILSPGVDRVGITLRVMESITRSVMPTMAVDDDNTVGDMKILTRSVRATLETDLSENIVDDMTGQERSPDQRGGQTFQIGNLPWLNNFHYQNSPMVLVTDRLFQTLVLDTDTSLFSGTPEQQASDPPEVPPSAASDQAFVDLASDRDDFSDLGDY